MLSLKQKFSYQQTNSNVYFYCLAFIFSFVFSHSIIAAEESSSQRQAFDPKLKIALQEAVSKADSFDDKYDATVWLSDMSNRLSKIVEDPVERMEILTTVHREATIAGVQPELALAVMEVESAFDRYAISVAGARGLMQIMPFWLDEIGVEEDNLFHIDTNIRFGCNASTISLTGMAKLLFLSHTPSVNTLALSDACLKGIQHPDLTHLDLTHMDFISCTEHDVLAADGIILGTTENFGGMAGLTKDFFERIYYPCLDKKQGLPVAIYIRAGQDGQGSKQGIERILTGLKWKLAQEILILRGSYQAIFLDQVEELGANFSAGLEADIF